ncbi:hypothetical protein LSCM1_05889 [Leishmania martiniquensis]|uniref:Uncharacterized protein n=1 Tax=Leishmania martiniquensis TaxID=1580590 RepID=A0A836GZB7_9TRYP|nr:hypothetical protein LSCM1_05889 [Leishmania martiniquensis]
MRRARARLGWMQPPARGVAAVASTALSVRCLRSTIVSLALLSPMRHCSSSATSSSTTSADRAHGCRNHFDQQPHQQTFHHHSLHEKGSSVPGGSAGVSGSGKQTHSGGCESDNSSSSSTQQQRQDENIYGAASATGQQRRQVRQQWEKSFFGRLHYEEGMHSRFAEAFKSEEEEVLRQSIAGQSHADMFPHWPEDEEAPLSEFKRLRPSLQLQYILNRLSSGERRIRYAADFGSLFMMTQLNLGEMMMREADTLLRELGWMNDDVAAKIQAVQLLASKIKYDFDLD